MTVFKNILGDLSAQQFLQSHWQRKPLMVPGAFAGYSSPISADELAGLSLEPDVESRVVLGTDPSGPWQVQHGPFQEADFRQLPESAWTLIVQAVDLWVPQVKELLSHFSFLPPWRFDDVMVSYAPLGGSAGPHFDEYDVFLIQVECSKRWQLGQIEDDNPPLLDNSDLRIVKNFQQTQEWLLAPGDMLYLPPRLSHWGIAETEGMTFSVGFRSPSLAELLADLAIELSAGNNDIYYRDPQLSVDMASERIHPAFVQQIQALLGQLLSDDNLMEDWFARFMTAPKYPGLEKLTKELRKARIDDRLYHNGDIVN